MNEIKNTRLEHDSIGKRNINADAYYGIQSYRAYENFPITGHRADSRQIVAIAQIKKACAVTNLATGILTKQISDAICLACDDIIDGKLHNQFIVDPIQGGAGTSFNMNANEVIANRAIEILGGKKGDYSIVNPNDHVNAGQSTNDVYPSSGKIAAVEMLKEAQKNLTELRNILEEKAQEFDNVIKMGRTQLQDAVPVRLGQEFHAYAQAVSRDIKRFELAKDELRTLNMGGTAIGTGLNADIYYYSHICEEITKITGEKYCQADDTIDGTQNLDCYPFVSGIIKTCAVTLSKMSNDLRLMSCGPRTGIMEINLPPKQNGSSIMPGKVNPVIPEVVSQVAFNIFGNDVTITKASEAGQLELNAFEPVIFYNLYESIHTLTQAVRTLIDNCITGITANREHCKMLVDNSVGIITAICPYIGYEKAADLAKQTLKENGNVKELILKQKVLTEEELAVILDETGMTSPGIAGKRRNEK